MACKQEQYYIDKILGLKDAFKRRGAAVVKQEQINEWYGLIAEQLTPRNPVWTFGVIVEATLQCMEKLSEGKTVEETYKLIDVRPDDSAPVYYGMIMNGNQNSQVTRLVMNYHERGLEFAAYRDRVITQNFVLGRRFALQEKFSPNKRHRLIRTRTRQELVQKIKPHI